jgi:hypothetical protein
VVHAYQNFTATDARLLIATMPGGFSEFFVELSAATPADAVALSLILSEISGRGQLRAPNGIDRFPHFAEMAKLAISIDRPTVRRGPVAIVMEIAGLTHNESPVHASRLADDVLAGHPRRRAIGARITIPVSLRRTQRPTRRHA